MNKRVIFLLLLFVATILFSESIKRYSSEWLSVQTKSDAQIAEQLKNEVITLTSTGLTEVDARLKELKAADLQEASAYTVEKNKLKSDLNMALSIKNGKDDQVTSLTQQISDKEVKIRALQGEKTNYRTIIEISQKKISDEKKRLKEEISRIPFYIVMIGRTDMQDYEVMADVKKTINSAITKEAVKNSLGTEIISKIISLNEVLTENEIKLMIKGVANCNLEGSKVFDSANLRNYLYQFGKVEVYPLQTEPALTGVSKASKKIEVEVVKDLNSGLTSNLKPAETAKLSEQLTEISGLNTENQSKLQNIANLAKSVISKENKKIKENESEVSLRETVLTKYNEELNILKSELITTKVQQNDETLNYSRVKSKYDSFVNGEKKFKIITITAKQSESQSNLDSYKELVIRNIEKFRTSVSSEGVSSETTYNNSQTTEKERGKIGSAKITDIRIIGKYQKNTENETGTDTENGVSIAYKYVFQIDETKDLKVNEAAVTVTGEPKDALIKVGKYILDSGVTQNIPMGKYSLHLEKYGYKSLDQEIDINNATYPITYQMQAYQILDYKIDSEPQGADVYFNSENKGKTPLEIKLLPGLYYITLSKAGYSDYLDSTQIKEGYRYNSSPTLYKLTREPLKSGNNLVLVEGGTFTLGDSKDAGSFNENTAHEVTVSSFYMGKYEVTQKEWFEIMGRIKNFKAADYPACDISWYQAVEYCNLRSIKEGLEPCYDIKVWLRDYESNLNVPLNDDIRWTVTCDFKKKGYRLPTEAEWEYAAKGGKNQSKYNFSGGNSLKKVGWFADNSNNEIQMVGLKLPNSLGLYDMSGNMEEWCWDWHGKFSDQKQTNPKGAESGYYKVIRGGSYSEMWDLTCGVSTRGKTFPPANSDHGLRIVISY